MNLRDMLAVRSLVIAGTTKGAAVNLGVSQPTVSRAIVEMEAHFGQQLFARHHGRLIPTAAALRVSRGAEEIGRVLHCLRQDLRTGSAEQTLRIGLSPDHSGAMVQQAVRRLTSMQHGTTIKICLMGEAELAQALVDGAVDVGLSAHPHPAEEVEVEQILSLNLCCIIPSGHRLESEQVLTPELLAGEPLVGIRADENRARQVQSAFHEAGVAFTEKFEVPSLSLACEFVGSGMGIALCPPFDLATSLHPIVVKPFNPAIEWRLFSLLHITGPMQQAARQFCRLVRLTSRKALGPAYYAEP